MAVSVRIEDEAFSDERFEDLAVVAGLADSDHARGKMARIWRQCTLEQRYVLPASIVSRILGDNGVNALIAARLGEKVDGGIRIHGTRGRIEWLKKLRSNGKFGKRGGRPKKNPRGFSFGNPTEPMRVTKNAEKITPPAPAPVPTSAPVLFPDPELDSTNPVKAKRAHAIPLGWTPAPAPPNLKAEKLATSRGVVVADELQAMHDWAAAKGETGKDWDARWRLWLRRAQPRHGNYARQQTTVEAALERLAIAQAEEADDDEKGSP